MFVSSSLAQPIVSLFFALPFNNLLHNLVLQMVRHRAHNLSPPSIAMRAADFSGRGCVNLTLSARITLDFRRCGRRCTRSRHRKTSTS